MVFSKATSYGIKALAYLARQSELRLCSLQEIATNENIPPMYLGKLLGELRRHRIIRSVKGIHGGYLLASPPQKVSLWDVFRVLDHDPYLDECFLCQSNADEPSCPFCKDWKRIRDDLVSILKNKTIADFASEL